MPNDIPSARFVLKRNYHPHWIVLTAYRAGGSDEVVSVEMNLDQWIKLQPVRYAVKSEISGRKPRQPAPVVPDPAVAPLCHVGTSSPRMVRNGSLSLLAAPKAKKSSRSK